MLALAGAAPDATSAYLWVSILIFAIGLCGIIFPVLPGLLLCLGAVLLWAAEVGGTRAWVTFAVCLTLYVIGVVLQITIPGRRMRSEGVGGATLLLGLVAAVVGFFVVPVVGAPLFFVGAVYLVEYSRYRDTGRAWTATKSAIKGVLRSMGVELATATTIALAWVVGIASHSL